MRYMFHRMLNYFLIFHSVFDFMLLFWFFFAGVGLALVLFRYVTNNFKCKVNHIFVLIPVLQLKTFQQKNQKRMNKDHTIFCLKG